MRYEFFQNIETERPSVDQNYFVHFSDSLNQYIDMPSYQGLDLMSRQIRLGIENPQERQYILEMHDALYGFVEDKTNRSVAQIHRGLDMISSFWPRVDSTTLSIEGKFLMRFTLLNTKAVFHRSLGEHYLSNRNWNDSRIELIHSAWTLMDEDRFLLQGLDAGNCWAVGECLSLMGDRKFGKSLITMARELQNFTLSKAP